MMYSHHGELQPVADDTRTQSAPTDAYAHAYATGTASGADEGYARYGGADEGDGLYYDYNYGEGSAPPSPHHDADPYADYNDHYTNTGRHNHGSSGSGSSNTAGGGGGRGFANTSGEWTPGPGTYDVTVLDSFAPSRVQRRNNSSSVFKSNTARTGRCLSV